MQCLLRCLALCFLLWGAVASAEEGEWQAGVAKAVITPRQSMWMSGYGSRDRPSEGTLHDLWCKVVTLQDPAGRRAVIVSLDLCGISRSVWDAMSEGIHARTGIARESVMILCSHTHTGPMVENNLETMFELDDVERGKIRDYTRALEATVADTVAESVKRLAPARIAWATGHASFAVNRRNNPEAKVPELRQRGLLKGPIDHDVPVLCVRDRDDAIQAIVFGYACHCTVLGTYQWTGDYAGFAQIELEKSHPSATALFFAGCGADQNPVPRRDVTHAERFGAELAEAVDQVLRGAMHAVSGDLSCRLEMVDLPFESVPTRVGLEKQIETGSVYEKRRAKKLVAELERNGSLSPTYPYPVQLWKLGPGLTWVALGGEVTVGYSLRLKRELRPGQTWVAAYANDVMAYIPTTTVWDEGGYEGAGAMVYYGLPTRWARGVEETIVERVHRMDR